MVLRAAPSPSWTENGPAWNYETIKKLAESRDYTRTEIASMVKVSPATLYRVLASV